MFNVQFMFNSFTIQCSIQCNTSCSIQCNFTNKGILSVSGGGQGFPGGTDCWWGVGEVTHVSIFYLLIKPSMLWLSVSVYNVCWWYKNGLKIHFKNCQKINQENILWFLCKGICAFWHLGNQGGHMNWWGNSKIVGKGGRDTLVKWQASNKGGDGGAKISFRRRIPPIPQSYGVVLDWFDWIPK